MQGCFLTVPVPSHSEGLALPEKLLGLTLSCTAGIPVLIPTPSMCCVSHLAILLSFLAGGLLWANASRCGFRLRHIPYHLLKYPVQAVRVLLAGFRPASNDKNVERIPYSPEWSLKALWTMMDCVEGKRLSASILVRNVFFPWFLQSLKFLLALQLLSLCFIVNPYSLKIKTLYPEGMLRENGVVFLILQSQSFWAFLLF